MAKISIYYWHFFGQYSIINKTFGVFLFFFVNVLKMFTVLGVEQSDSHDQLHFILYKFFGDLFFSINFWVTIPTEFATFLRQFQSSQRTLTLSHYNVKIRESGNLGLGGPWEIWRSQSIFQKHKLANFRTRYKHLRKYLNVEIEILESSNFIFLQFIIS